MSSSALTPKGLKAALTTLREAVTSLEKDGGGSSAASAAFCLVLTSELASRGVGVELPTTPPKDGYDAGWIASLLGSVRDAAGKVPIDDTGSSSGFPPPMLAALNAASGMAASACSAACDVESSTGTPPLLPMTGKPGKSIEEALHEAMKRCEEVDDGRFYALLKLALASNTEGLPQRELRRHFNSVAYANYLYGASNFAKDQPPIWKRCLDAALENARLSSEVSAADVNSAEYKSYRNSETILPLRNMIRIAQSKGNEKRVKELSLFLSVGYLGGVEERLERMKKECGTNSFTKDKEGEGKPKLNDQSFDQLLQHHFLRRSSVLVELVDFSTTQTLLDAAKESLALCDCPAACTPENYETYLLYHYIQVQVERLKEESTIWIDVHRQHRAMLNRRPEGESSGGKGGGVSIGSKKASVKSIGAKGSVAAPKAQTREEMEKQTRSRVYLDAWNEWKSGPPELDSLSPLALRDAVVRLSPITETAPTISTDIVRDCYDVLFHQVERLVEIAVLSQKTRAKKGGATAKESLGWQLVLSFASSLMLDHLHSIIGSGGSISPLPNMALRRLAESCAEGIVSACWMSEPFASCGKGDEVYDFANVSGLLSAAHACLVQCQTQRNEEEKRLVEEKKKKESSVVSSQDRYSDEEKNEILLLQCALAASKCRTDMVNAVGGDESELGQALIAAARRATVAATAAAKSNPSLKTSSSLSHSSASAMFGAPYLQFLSVWSGLYHSPWPFCTLGQARTILRSARESLSAGVKAWGRDSSSTIEQMLLDVGEADLEGGLTGGFQNVSEKLYRLCMIALKGDEGDSSGMSKRVRNMLMVHCLLGLATLSLSGDLSDVMAAEELARDALGRLGSIDSSGDDGPSHALMCMYPWKLEALDKLSHSYHTCASRQLVAEACIRSSRPEDALAFLNDAVKDSPGNFEAAFALASFHLRTMLGSANDENEAKKTRMLLLKSAKMDTAKPDPFALLGVWYESQNDASRAKGCYQKALAIDPSHPVAGRGLVRNTDVGDLQALCQNAANRNSPMNGWAWRVLGQQRSKGDGDDSAAIICFQQALRCRDIQAPGSDILGAFYSNPTVFTASACCDASETWAELAACYRRLGKYSAALRAYEAAYAVSDGNLSADALCAWAQVDLDLGLYDEAAEKCDMVLSMDSSLQIRRMAAFIEGESLLFLARNDIQEGKYGSCLTHLRKGISKLSTLPLNENSKGGYYCEVKLLGDLYTSGHSLPSYVFAATNGLKNDTAQEATGKLSTDIENQLSFIKKGEEAYTLALELGNDVDGDEEDNKCLMSAAAADLGTNLLSQARIVSMALGEGSGGATKTSLPDLAAQSNHIRNLISRSINAYLRAVDSSPHEAPAWCGLGCALVAVDPLLSQHAFSRALEIDPSLADAWSNIGLLYADHHTGKCSEILDYLTQIEDTPLMWIGRGFLLEKTSKAWKDQASAKEACLTKAADAYRAALQIMQHPAALLGLSLTCRRADPALQESNNVVYSSLANQTSQLESKVTLSIHQNMTNEGNIGACFVSGLAEIEEGLERLKCGDTKQGDQIATATQALDKATSRSTKEAAPEVGTDEAQCEIDVSSGMQSLKLSETVEFPYATIKTAATQAMAICSEQGLAETTGMEDLSLDGARNSVHLNPESGEAWLTFAKKLVSEAGGDFMALRQAKAAAKKARDLLHDRIVFASLLTPRRQALQGNTVEYSEKSVVSSLPSASLLSESMALVSWLEDAEALENSETTSRTLASLQESLMLDPANAIAAASLGIGLAA